MKQYQQAGDEAFVRRYEDEDQDEWTVAADVGAPDGAVDVDVVGQTAIVVIETEEGVHEVELDLPSEADRIETNNGVLAISGGTA